MTGSLPAVPLDRLADDDPREIGGYRLLGRLGAGGMGIAYLAEGPDGWAVVKTMWPHLRTDPAFRARLGRELDAMRAAASQQVAAVYDQELNGANPWFAMEFVPGVTLRRRVEEGGALTGREVTELASGLATALSVTSSAGVVHRDLKPSNVMMSPTGPRLIDFGVADMAEATQLTATGFVVGSAGWLAPEQITGGDITSATDVHAWGLCVLYAATGAAPFSGDNTTATIYQVLHSVPDVPSSLGELAPLVRSALEKDPAARPSVDRLQANLNGALREGDRTSIEALAATAITRPASQPRVPAVQSSNARRGLLMGVGLGALVLLLVGVGIALGRGGTSAAPTTTATAAPSPVSTPTLTITKTATAAPAPLSTPTPSSTPKKSPAPTPAPIAKPGPIPRSAVVQVNQSDTCPNAFGVTGAELLVDGDTNSGWRCDDRASNAEGNINGSSTLGESVDFYFDRSYTFTGVQVVEGAGGTAFRWCENGRLSAVDWNFNDGLAPEADSFPNRVEWPQGDLFLTTTFPTEHTTDHVTMTVIDIYPSGTQCFENGEAGRPWEYGPTAKPSEVRFIGMRA